MFGFSFNKRGSVFDSFGVVIGIFIFVLLLIIFTIITIKIGTTKLVTDSATTQGIYNEAGRVFLGIGDNLVLAFFVGLTIVGLVSAILSRANIVFLFVAIIVIAIILVLSVVLSNAYEKFFVNPDVASAVAFYPKTHFLMMHLPTMSMAVAFLIGLAVFIQWRRGGVVG